MFSLAWACSRISLPNNFVISTISGLAMIDFSPDYGYLFLLLCILVFFFVLNARIMNFILWGVRYFCTSINIESCSASPLIYLETVWSFLAIFYALLGKTRAMLSLGRTSVPYWGRIPLTTPPNSPWMSGFSTLVGTEYIPLLVGALAIVPSNPLKWFFSIFRKFPYKHVLISIYLKT